MNAKKIIQQIDALLAMIDDIPSLKNITVVSYELKTGKTLELPWKLSKEEENASL